MGNSKRRIKNRTLITKDKSLLIEQEFRYMLARTIQMFEWGNLPETIPEREMEIIVQLSKFAIFKKVKDEFFVFWGGLGGLPDVYYHPSDAIISNPYLKYFDVVKIDEECVVIWNDSAKIGLSPMLNKYSELIAENIISLRWAIINSRIPYLVSADNDSAKDSAVAFFENVEAGEKMGVIASSTFFEGIKSNDYSSRSTHIKDLMESLQYLRATWFNELGLNANYNMKREAINDAEAGMNEDALLPLIDDMLRQRQIAVEKINKMYNLNISVSLSSAWKKIREEIKHVQEDSQNDSLKDGGDE